VSTWRGDGYFPQDTVTPKDRENSAAGPRQRRSIAEKRRIVEETLMAGASVARVARRHGVNANQVFGWRRLYLSRTTWRNEARIKLRPNRDWNSRYS
jgi:transposase-like protein